MKNAYIALMIALAVIVAGCAPAMTEKKDGEMKSEWTPEQIAEMEKEEAMKKESEMKGEWTPEQIAEMENKETMPATAPETRYSPDYSTLPAPLSQGVQRTVGGYVGNVLAGSYAPLLEYNKQDYVKALKDGKIVVLYFYASWCPACKAEFPVMQQVFDGLTTDKIVGFRVHFNDPETDDAARALAKQFGVAYQHTKVILVGGKQTLKSPESWDKDRYDSEITKVVG